MSATEQNHMIGNYGRYDTGATDGPECPVCGAALGSKEEYSDECASCDAYDAREAIGKTIREGGDDAELAEYAEWFLKAYARVSEAK